VAFSVGRRAEGVADHFDEPRDVREWLARLIDGNAAAER
jgi:trehalose 6-phosphate phosphatase